MIDNAMDLSAFNRAKPADARFNLGLIGVSQVAKDPLWAIDVLERVRKQDERYRLLLVGGDMDPKTSRATKDYLKEFERQLEPLVESGAGGTSRADGRRTVRAHRDRHDPELLGA